MTIRYANGKTIEAVLLSRDARSLRAVVPHADDVVEFANVNGTWISDDCEPAHIEFAVPDHTRSESVTEADCLCSQELAARLVELLRNPAAGSRQERIAVLTAGPMRLSAPAII
jgi:hypothetical protein